MTKELCCCKRVELSVCPSLRKSGLFSSINQILESKFCCQCHYVSLHGGERAISCYMILATCLKNVLWKWQEKNAFSHVSIPKDLSPDLCLCFPPPTQLKRPKWQTEKEGTSVGAVKAKRAIETQGKTLTHAMTWGVLFFNVRKM